MPIDEMELISQLLHSIANVPWWALSAADPGPARLPACLPRSALRAIRNAAPSLRQQLLHDGQAERNERRWRKQESRVRFNFSRCRRFRLNGALRALHISSPSQTPRPAERPERPR